MSDTFEDGGELGEDELDELQQQLREFKTATLLVNNAQGDELQVLLTHVLGQNRALRELLLSYAMLTDRGHGSLITGDRLREAANSLQVVPNEEEDES